MEKFVTSESPGKVLSLLFISVVSMFLMTAVTVSEVSWEGGGVALADPFSPKNVMAFIDETAHVYSTALNNYVIQPAVKDYAFIPENLVWIKNNPGDVLATLWGVEEVQPLIAPAIGRVAGAYTRVSFPYMHFSSKQ